MTTATPQIKSSLAMASETKAQRLERTKAEFERLLEESLAVPFSEYKAMDIDAIEAAYDAQK